MKFEFACSKCLKIPIKGTVRIGTTSWFFCSTECAEQFGAQMFAEKFEFKKASND